MRTNFLPFSHKSSLLLLDAEIPANKLNFQKMSDPIPSMSGGSRLIESICGQLRVYSWSPSQPTISCNKSKGINVA